MKPPLPDSGISGAPDRMVISILDPVLVHKGLSANRLIRTGSFLRSVDSTNRRAVEMVQNRTATSGSFLCAEEQTAGFGRRGRTWWSPPHLNLYLSVILKNNFEPGDLFLVTALCANAVRTALNGCCGVKADIKWPNDVTVSGKKISGILVETEDDFLIAGIGVNVNMDPGHSVDLKKTATSVHRETGEDCAREPLLIRILTGLEEAYLSYPDRKADLFSEWEKALVWPKRLTTARTPEGTFKGRMTGVLPDGRAALETASGKIIGVMPETDRI